MIELIDRRLYTLAIRYTGTSVRATVIAERAKSDDMATMLRGP